MNHDRVVVRREIHATEYAHRVVELCLSTEIPQEQTDASNVVEFMYVAIASQRLAENKWPKANLYLDERTRDRKRARERERERDKESERETEREREREPERHRKSTCIFGILSEPPRLFVKARIRRELLHECLLLLHVTS